MKAFFALLILGLLRERLVLTAILGGFDNMRPDLLLRKDLSEHALKFHRPSIEYSALRRADGFTIAAVDRSIQRLLLEQGVTRRAAVVPVVERGAAQGRSH